LSPSHPGADGSIPFSGGGEDEARSRVRFSGFGRSRGVEREKKREWAGGEAGREMGGA